MALSLPRHPSLYEINTRVLLHTIGDGATISDVPDQYWQDLRDRGVDWVWLMGVWLLREKTVNPHVIPETMMEEFRMLLPGLRSNDICGSTYAIEDYAIDPAIGTGAQIADMRKKLNALGMRLMLDFIPNHFGAHSHWLREHPEYFIEVDTETALQDHHTFYKPWPDEERYFAHAKDPYFDAWQDTAQVNYANVKTRHWMIRQLRQIAEMCDGVRCDMAMLIVRHIFLQTWGHIKDIAAWERQEFWTEAIAIVKDHHPDFILLAECYWDMEAELLEMGFDYCYDKEFFDLTNDNGDAIVRHFEKEDWWLERTARFLENHDEVRVSARLSLQKHMAAAALLAFGPGMRFWHHGQWDGLRKRIPVQLRSKLPEVPCGCLLSPMQEDGICGCISLAYRNLMQWGKLPVFRHGTWQPIAHDATVHLILWLWQYADETVLAAINYSGMESTLPVKKIRDALRTDHVTDMMDGGRKTSLISIRHIAPWAVHLWRAVVL